MRGISEDRLIELKDNDCYTGIEKSVIYELISDECQELNPWLPIDGNTPKDRNLLLINKDKSKFIGYFDTCINVWCVQGTTDFVPTHYQELPNDPEPGDKNA